CRGTAEALRAIGEAGGLPPQAHRELLDALTQLRHVQALLTLLREGPSPSDTLLEADAATLARCAGAVDFAALDADITAAAASVHGWYRRLIEEPARCAATEAAEQKEKTEDEPRSRWQGPRFNVADRRWGQRHVVQARRQEGGGLFLPEGRHFRLHRRGLRVSRRLPRLWRDRSRGHRDIEGLSRLTRQ